MADVLAMPQEALSIPKTPSVTKPSQERLNADMIAGIPFAGQKRPMLGNGVGWVLR